MRGQERTDEGRPGTCFHLPVIGRCSAFSWFLTHTGKEGKVSALGTPPPRGHSPDPTENHPSGAAVPFGPVLLVWASCPPCKAAVTPDNFFFGVGRGGKFIWKT